ncbi:IS4 family transposase [Aquella oligotrophica]|uniref:IS4 family transposase n=1 Tax=Aquella oligotrophica TaxID=2067065 RepID=A0A2I7N6E0_9NEIS|nr:IS4 family transposase [Aquella oligotrophica]AUR52024.1 IS4 family transposase [Aquella oligotrophica]
MEDWVINELKDIELGDKRLNIRCRNILNGLSVSPEKSIPGALESWRETKAAYRFFSNNKVDEVKILEPHINATKERMSKESVVLLLQDTTDIDYSKYQSLTDMGFLGEKKIEHRHGFFLHPTIAVTPDKVNLGVAHSITWKREQIKNQGLRKVTPIEEKESYNWLLSYRETKEIARQIPNTQFINIGDRECDIYEFFHEYDSKIGNANFIVRSGRDRCTSSKGLKVWEQLRRAPVIANIKFKLPRGWHTPRSKAKVKREVRTVVQDVRSVEVELTPSSYHPSSLSDVRVYAVMASEINAENLKDKVEWVLFTTIPVTTAEDALKIIQYYICRWQIELYFKILKSGCNIESRQLENYGRLKTLLAIFMIVAWRIQYITMFGRTNPDQPCDVIFSNAEWQSVYVILNKDKVLPAHPPTIYQMIRMIAQLGGFLGRKNDGEPGIKTIWTGWQKMKDYALAWEVFNTHKNTCG